jgi:hypothetical protein
MTFKMTRRALLLLVLIAPLALSLTVAAQAKVDVTGTWAFDVQTDQGSGNPTIVFKQDGEKLTGKYTGTFGEADVAGTIKGNEIAFSFSSEAQGFQLTSSYKGTVESATTMKGTLDISGLGTGTFTATKK